MNPVFGFYVNLQRVSTPDLPEGLGEFRVGLEWAGALTIDWGGLKSISDPVNEVRVKGNGNSDSSAIQGTEGNAFDASDIENN